MRCGKFNLNVSCTMKFYMIELHANDPIASAEWYCKILNYDVIFRDDVNGFILLEHAGSRIAFKRRESSSNDMILHFHVENLKQELLRLAKIGIFPIGELKTSHEGYRRATLHDCEGRIIILFEWLKHHARNADSATS